jgi:hypothetical protein
MSAIMDTMNPFTMRANFSRLFIPVLIAAVALSCNKTDDLTSEPLSDYMPLQTGKFITYRLDSTVFVDFNTVAETHYYQEKHIIDIPVPDALGRPSFRVFRYIRDSAGSLPWSPAGSYFLTPTGKTIEKIENNLRFVKLSLPLKEEFSWNPNHFLPDNPLRALYSFQNDGDMEMDDWNAYYSSMGETDTLRGKIIHDVVTVNGVDRFENIPINVNVYASVDHQLDKYAKGIGLVYQEWAMWDFQPPHDNIPSAQKHGFIIKRTMIDHN